MSELLHKKQPKILIVDDEKDICNVLDSFLSLEYDTVSTTDSEEAMQILDKEEFDLVITDIKMPKYDGFDICNKVNNVSPTTYIILITGFADLDLAIKGMKEGTFDFIRKPFTIEEIMISVKRAFKIKEALRKEKEYEKQKSILELVEGLKDKLVNRITAAIWTRDFVEETLAEKLGEEESEQLQVLKESLERVLEIATKLSEYTSEFVSVNDKVDISLLMNQLPSRHQDVTIEITGEEITDEVIGQDEQLVECFDALIENSIEASIKKPIEVTINLEKVNGFIRISFADNGEGIPNEFVDKVFTPFFTTKGTKATGLGLWLVYQKIKHFGGNVEIDSVSKQGTVVTIELPIVT